jgi:hypothetical protein
VIVDHHRLDFLDDCHTKGGQPDDEIGYKNSP